MTNGMIPVNNRAGELVAVLHWSGHPMTGKKRWEYIGDGASELIGQALKQGKEFGKIAFSDMYAEGATTRGWEGFSGWFQALSQALPAVNLEVDAESIEWPSAEITLD